MCRRAGAKRSIGDIAGAELDEQHAAEIKQALAPVSHATSSNPVPQASVPDNAPVGPPVASDIAELPLPATEPSPTSQPISSSAGLEEPPARTGPASGCIHDNPQHEADTAAGGSGISHEPAAAPAAADDPDNHAVNAAEPAAETSAEHVSQLNATANRAPSSTTKDGDENVATTPQTLPLAAERASWQQNEPSADGAKENSSLLANPPGQKQAHGAQQDDSSDVLCMPSTPDLPAEQSPVHRNSPKRKGSADNRVQLKHDVIKASDADAVRASASSPQQDVTHAPLPTSDSDSQPTVERSDGHGRHVDNQPANLTSASAAGPSTKASSSGSEGGDSKAAAPLGTPADLMQEKAARWAFKSIQCPDNLLHVSFGSLISLPHHPHA